LRWYEEHGVFYSFGLARNTRLEDKENPRFIVTNLLCQLHYSAQKRYADLYCPRGEDELIPSMSRGSVR
jgi:hypothetical protein